MPLKIPSVPTSSSPAPTNNYYYVYIKSLSNITIFYSFDVDKQALVPLSENLLGDTKHPSTFIQLGTNESGLVLKILEQKHILESSNNFAFPTLLKIEDATLFRHFLPNKRRRASSNTDTAFLLSKISTACPSYVPPQHYNAQHALESLKAFRIGLGSMFLSFEEARLAITIYSQLVKFRPFNLLHSETTRDSYAVNCYKPDCRFAVTIRPFVGPLPPQYRTPLIIIKFEEHTCDPYTHVFQSQRKNISASSPTLLPRLTYPKCMALVFDFIRPPGKTLTSGERDLYYDLLEEIFKVNEAHHSFRTVGAKMNSQRELAYSFVNDMFMGRRDRPSAVHVSAFYLQVHSPLTCIRMTYSNDMTLYHAPPYEIEKKSSSPLTIFPVPEDAQANNPPELTQPSKFKILFDSPESRTSFHIWKVEYYVDLNWELREIEKYSDKTKNRLTKSNETDSSKQASENENSKSNEGHGNNLGENSDNLSSSNVTSNSFNETNDTFNNSNTTNSTETHSPSTPDEFEIKTPFFDFSDSESSESDIEYPGVEEESDSRNNDTHFEIPFRLSDMHFFPKVVQEKLAETSTFSEISDRNERIKGIASMTGMFSIVPFSQIEHSIKTSSSNSNVPDPASATAKNHSSVSPTVNNSTSLRNPEDELPEKPDELLSSYLDNLKPMFKDTKPHDYLPSYCDIYQCANERNGQHPGYCPAHDKHFPFIEKYKELIENRTQFNPYVLGDYFEKFYPNINLYKNSDFKRMTIITADMRRMASSATTSIEVGHISTAFSDNLSFSTLLAVGNTPEHNITILGACFTDIPSSEAYVEFFTELKLAYGDLFEKKSFSFISESVELIPRALSIVFPKNRHLVSLSTMSKHIFRRSIDLEIMELISSPDKDYVNKKLPHLNEKHLEVIKDWAADISKTPCYGRNYNINASVVSILLSKHKQCSGRISLAINNLQSDIIVAQRKKIQSNSIIKFNSDDHAFVPAASSTLAHATLFIDIFNVKPCDDSLNTFVVTADDDSLIRCLKNNTSAIPLLHDALYFHREGVTPIRRVRIKVTQTLSEYHVDLKKKECTCTFYQDLQLPCIHALACIVKYRNSKVSRFSSSIYYIEQYLKTLNSCDALTLNPTVTDLQFIYSALSKIKLSDLKYSNLQQGFFENLKTLIYMSNEYLKYPYSS